MFNGRAGKIWEGPVHEAGGLKFVYEALNSKLVVGPLDFQVDGSNCPMRKRKTVLFRYTVILFGKI